VILSVQGMFDITHVFAAIAILALSASYGWSLSLWQNALRFLGITPPKDVE
jgi:hypothetical protein